MKATVLDSNVLTPGSTFELRVAPGHDCSCEVEMTLKRDFRRSAAGRIAFTLNHLAGERLFGSMLHRTLKAVERASGRTDTAKAAA